ncbi:NAD(P)H-binding protein [Epidermidibacterium keratini]|uniref:NAD(P)H-binding protein n=1 Tax=Epidermidibacterium keratini TaxID=1891644 RepID=A0A7L4YMU3_9ACTN|nr:NAD(P)H-binding protein [Epidermidibacterium keratini]QHC00203.1 NAD(P)H-binding protein [Epidermidibacterium keratini]
MKTLVVGASGRVGGAAVELLRERGDSVTALTRSADAPLPADVERYVADLTDISALSQLPFSDATFLVFPSVTADPYAAEIADALAARTGHIVYLSAHGAADADPEGEGIMPSHARVERELKRTGVRRTFLRSSGFAANTLGWAPYVKAGQPIRGIAADARRALIHERDLAAVGVHEMSYVAGDLEQILHLTGPEVMTQREYADALSSILGGDYPFVELSDDDAARELFPDAPPAMVRSILEGQRRMIAEPEPRTDTVAQVLGRPATPYSQWVRDHQGDFTA